MKFILRMYEKYRELVNYLFWGVMTTLVSWGTYALFSSVLASVIEDTVVLTTTANILSILCAVVFAFITNKLWVFESKSWSGKVVLPELARFFSARLVTAILEAVGVPLLVGLGLDGTVLGIEGMVSKAVVSVAVVILNYVFSKLFVFKRGK